MAKVVGVINGGPKKLHFYNLDACEEVEGQHDFDFRSNHYRMQRAVRMVVKKRFDDCEYHDVIFPPGSKGKAPLRYFEEELGKLNAANDAIMVWYHGKAYGRNEDYKLKFSGYPKKEIDGFKFIKLFVESGFDVTLIMDCQVPNRWQTKFASSEGTGMVEIIARGDEMLRSDGKRDEDEEGAFTVHLCILLDNLVEKITVSAKDGGFKGWHAPRSIPEALRFANLAFNPRRVWLNRPTAGSEEYIARCVLDPEHIRETGKISWFYKQIQGEKPHLKRGFEKVDLVEEDPVDEG